MPQIDWSLYDALAEAQKRQERQEILLKYLVCKLEGTEPPKMVKKRGKKIYITYAHQKGK